MPSSEGEDNYRDIEKGSNFAVFLFSLFYLRLFPCFASFAFRLISFLFSLFLSHLHRKLCTGICGCYNFGENGIRGKIRERYELKNICLKVASICLFICGIVFVI